MKKQRNQASDNKTPISDRELRRQQLALVRGGGVGGTGVKATDDGVIHAQ